MGDEIYEEEDEDEPTRLELWKERAGVKELYQSEYDEPLARLLNEYGDKLTDNQFTWLEIRRRIRYFTDGILYAIKDNHEGLQRDHSHLRQQIVDVLTAIDPSNDAPVTHQPEPPTPQQIELLTDRFHILPSVIAKLTKVQAARMIAEHSARGDL